MIVEFQSLTQSKQDSSKFGTAPFNKDKLGTRQVATSHYYLYTVKNLLLPQPLVRRPYSCLQWVESTHIQFSYGTVVRDFESEAKTR